MTTASSKRQPRPAASSSATGKAPGAFRTISEVSDELSVPQHVLRFWESRFSQVRPLKRGGGRRYYRPEDVALLRRIRDLLYNERYTIKGVQKLLREGQSSGSKATPEPKAVLDPALKEVLRGLLAELKAMRSLIEKNGT
ncbi:MAG: MerR family transcriptional regulator [Kiloniellales bacterium]